MSCGNKVLGGSPHIRRGADRLSALRTRPLCPLNSRYTTVFVKPGEQRTRAARENPSQGVDGGREANHRKRAGTNWFIAPGTFRFASSFFSTPSLHTHRFTAYLFEHKKQHVHTRLHVFKKCIHVSDATFHNDFRNRKRFQLYLDSRQAGHESWLPTKENKECCNTCTCTCTYIICDIINNNNKHVPSSTFHTTTSTFVLPTET